MGEDSCPEGRGFESQHCMLDGHISLLFVVKIILFVLMTKNVWPILKNLLQWPLQYKTNLSYL